MDAPPSGSIPQNRVRVKAGQLETQYGRMHMLVYNPAANGAPASITVDAKDLTQTFMWQELPAMRQVARDLLRLVLEVLETE